MKSFSAYMWLAIYFVTGVQGKGYMLISLVNGKLRRQIANNDKNTFLFDDNGTIMCLDAAQYFGFSESGEFVMLDSPYLGFDLTSIAGSMSKYEVSLNNNSRFYLCRDKRIFIDKRCSGARAARITYVKYL
ncbi:hypothetical protein OXX69_004480 [Metschnikowia pulcherrima]